MHRQPHQTRLMHDRALDVLADPPRRIGREAEPALGLELADRMHQAEVAFLDQVGHRQAAAEIVLCDADNEPQVVLDHRLARCEVAESRACRSVELLLWRQQRCAANFAQIGLQRVADFGFAGGDVSANLRFDAMAGHRVDRFAVEARRQHHVHHRVAAVALSMRSKPAADRRMRMPVGWVAPLDHACSGVRRASLALQRGGSSLAGSIGLPSLRISKCSCTRSASVAPISAIFCPRRTA